MARREHRPIFRQLRGKALSYGWVSSVMTFLIFVFLALGFTACFVIWKGRTAQEDYLKKEAPLIETYFVHGLPNREGLTIELRTAKREVVSENWFSLGQDHFIFLAVVDTQDQVIASVGTHRVPPNTPIEAQLSSQGRAILSNRKWISCPPYQEADGTIVAITPIVKNGKNVQGKLVMKIARPNRLWQLQQFMDIFTPPGAYPIALCFSIAAITAIMCGTGFSYLIARSLTRRLKGLLAAADRWSHGDFSGLPHDALEDELGQMARQFNHMAEQLQNLLQTQQKLATLEERNRLARDLHDSVKQQVFALSMQIGATKGWLRRNVDTAEERLNEAQRLVRQTQRELTSLIRQLRPVALEDKGLVAALCELATEWTQQTDIVANLHVEGAQTLPPTVEDALFRVAQEALANVARHSKATLVQMTLTITDDSGTLSIIDNGQGFDTTHHKPLGIGLSSMQERMKAFGGGVQVESTPGKGTRVVAYCKLSSGDTGDAGM